MNRYMVNGGRLVRLYFKFDVDICQNYTVRQTIY